MIILSAIPFGMLCAIWGQANRGLQVRFPFMGGMTALATLAVSQALVVIAFIYRNTIRGASVGNAVRTAGDARFRAILLASLTTRTGVAPLILEKSLQAQLLIPTAVAAAACVLIARGVTLAFVPATYLVMDDIGSRALRLVRGTSRQRG